MLVLTRKYQEKIRIGDNITITVLRTKGKAVRLGIEAPPEVPVIRGELSFQCEAAPAIEQTAAAEFSESKSRNGRTAATATTMRWSADSRPHMLDAAIVPPVEPKVELSRVSRSKIANLRPKLDAGNAPLRAMMRHDRS
jgi:carbon storage regulator